MNIPLNIHLPQNIWQNLQTAQEFVTQSAQQIQQSVQETATQTTNIAIDKVTNTIEQSKDYFQNSWLAAEQIQNTVSLAIQSSISSLIDNLFTQNPSLLRIWQILNLAISHPIISAIILLFLIALIWSIIKGIVKLIETASWSVLKVPLNLLGHLIKIGFFSIIKLSNSTIAKIKGESTNIDIVTVTATNLYKTKQQRLAEISQRLTAIHQEQQALLQEASELMSTDAQNSPGVIKQLIANTNGQGTSG
ncbi:MAG TPA: hypothetical protein VK203_17625 [Nostocaceae cyanobacterium]|nr:hypothetical protein [Nostocaceae cyanobacterium]